MGGFLSKHLYLHSSLCTVPNSYSAPSLCVNLVLGRKHTEKDTDLVSQGRWFLPHHYLIHVLICLHYGLASQC